MNQNNIENALVTDCAELLKRAETAEAKLETAERERDQAREELAERKSLIKGLEWQIRAQRSHHRDIEEKYVSTCMGGTRLGRENRLLYDALDTLLRAKDEKETNGKTLQYESLATEGWQKARLLRTAYDEHRKHWFSRDGFFMEPEELKARTGDIVFEFPHRAEADLPHDDLRWKAGHAEEGEPYIYRDFGDWVVINERRNSTSVRSLCRVLYQVTVDKDGPQAHQPGQREAREGRGQEK